MLTYIILLFLAISTLYAMYYDHIHTPMVISYSLYTLAAPLLPNFILHVLSVWICVFVCVCVCVCVCVWDLINIKRVVCMNIDERFCTGVSATYQCLHYSRFLPAPSSGTHNSCSGTDVHVHSQLQRPCQVQKTVFHSPPFWSSSTSCNVPWCYMGYQWEGNKYINCYQSVQNVICVINLTLSILKHTYRVFMLGNVRVIQ